MANKGNISSIMMGNDTIIKVIGKSENYVYGYDIITEEFCQLEKKTITNVTPSILKLIGSERAQVLIAEDNSKTGSGVAKILGVSDRTAYRKLSQFTEVEHPNQWSKQ